MRSVGERLADAEAFGDPLGDDPGPGVGSGCAPSGQPGAEPFEHPAPLVLELPDGVPQFLVVPQRGPGLRVGHRLGPLVRLDGGLVLGRRGGEAGVEEGAGAALPAVGGEVALRRGVGVGAVAGEVGAQGGESLRHPAGTRSPPDRRG